MPVRPFRPPPTEVIRRQREKLATDQERLKQKEKEFKRKRALYNQAAQSRYAKEHSAKVLKDDDLKNLVFENDEELELWKNKENPSRLLSLDIGRTPAQGMDKWAFRSTIHLTYKKVKDRQTPRRTLYIELWRRNPTITLRRQFSLADLKDFITWAEWLRDIDRGVIFNSDTNEFEPRYHKVRAFNEDLWHHYAKGRFPEFKCKPRT